MQINKFIVMSSWFMENIDEPITKAKRTNNQIGQSLVELIAVVAIAVIVIGALVFAIIASIRNASFAKNQAQATKYAQEGLERVRSGRDRNSAISNFTLGGQIVDNWQDNDLWSNQISTNCIPNCYFKLSSGGAIQYISAASSIPSLAETIPNTPFRRAIILSDKAPTYTVEKEVTAIVSWTDFSGAHQSTLTTILRRL